MRRTQPGRRKTRVQPVPTLEEETALLLALEDQEEGAEYDLGSHYNLVVDHGLWKQGPYRGPTDFFRKVIKSISLSELWLYGTIARHFTRESALRHGMSNLAALQTYAGLTHLELPEEPSSVIIVVPRKEGGTVKKKFMNCSRTELRAACRRARGQPGDSEDIPPADLREVSNLRGTFGNVAGHDGPARFRATYSNGMTLVSLERLPLHRVWEICQALGHPPWPAPAPEPDVDPLPDTPGVRTRRRGPS